MSLCSFAAVCCQSHVFAPRLRRCFLVFFGCSWTPSFVPGLCRPLLFRVCCCLAFLICCFQSFVFFPGLRWSLPVLFGCSWPPSVFLISVGPCWSVSDVTLLLRVCCCPSHVGFPGLRRSSCSYLPFHGLRRLFLVSVCLRRLAVPCLLLSCCSASVVVSPASYFQVSVGPSWFSLVVSGLRRLFLVSLRRFLPFRIWYYVDDPRLSLSVPCLPSWSHSASHDPLSLLLVCVGCS